MYCPHAIIAVYFAVVLGIGFAARQAVHSGLDFFLLYGTVLTVMGLAASDDGRAKAAGININLWAGLCILVGGAVFLAWVALRPLRTGDLQDTDSDRPKVE